MDAFSYLAVLISIILGLGITHLLSGLGRVLQERKQTRSYWPAMTWVVLLLFLHVQTWWAMFGLRLLSRWTFPTFVLVLLQPIILFLLTALVLPEQPPGSAVDLKASYYAQSRTFFGLAVILLVVSLTRDRVLSGHFPGPLNTVMHGVFFLAWSGAAITKSERYHQVVAVSTALLMVVYVMALSLYLK
jgi:hypothetical protein